MKMKDIYNIIIVDGFIIAIAMDFMGYPNNMEYWLLRISLITLCISVFMRSKL